MLEIRDDDRYEVSSDARNTATEGLDLPIGGLDNRRENIESQLQKDAQTLR